MKKPIPKKDYFAAIGKDNINSVLQLLYDEASDRCNENAKLKQKNEELKQQQNNNKRWLKTIAISLDQEAKALREYSEEPVKGHPTIELDKLKQENEKLRDRSKAFNEESKNLWSANDFLKAENKFKDKALTECVDAIKSIYDKQVMSINIVRAIKNGSESKRYTKKDEAFGKLNKALKSAEPFTECVKCSYTIENGMRQKYKPCKECAEKEKE